MIDVNTVFIIGAGASYPYGFPLGLELRKLAYLKAFPMFQSFHLRRGGDFLIDDFNLAQKFTRQFKSSADQSIDWFLKKFPEYSEVGKILILDIILQAENDSKFLEEMKPDFRNQDWYWYLYNVMSKYPKGAIDPNLFLQNRVAFITFNYDRSLEHFFFSSFSNGHNFDVYKTSAKELFSKIPIRHVYGKVATLDWEREENKQFVGYRGYVQSYDTLNNLKDNIKLIDERKERKNYEFGNLIVAAKRIFFLGFSYADENLEMLDIPEVLTKDQEVFGTAYGMTENEINKIKIKFSSKINDHNLKIEPLDCLGLLRKYL